MMFKKNRTSRTGEPTVGELGMNAEIYRSDADQRTSRNGALAPPLFTFAVAFAVVLGLAHLVVGEVDALSILAALVVAGLASASFHVALEWEKVAVLRLGKLSRIAGPGLFLTIPIVESCTLRIDQRVMVTPFGAEQTLTSDLVPVNVDAVLFWMVWDSKKACTEVEDYRFAVTLSAQTTLRDAIGRGSAATLATHRTHLDKQLKKEIDEKVSAWGVTVMSVEIRDILIPEALQEAMSAEAQAERQKHARISLMEAERDITEILTEIDGMYGERDRALQLRMMHLLYESIKETGGTVVVPSSFSEGFTGKGFEELIKPALK